MLSAIHRLLLKGEVFLKKQPPHHKRFLLIFLILMLISGEVLWERIQELRYQEEFQLLEDKNQELRQRIHLLIKLEAAQEVDLLRDSLKETPRP